jgi:hypothetical protein
MSGDYTAVEQATDGSTVATPASGNLTLFPGTDGNWYLKRPDGTVLALSVQQTVLFTQTASVTVANTTSETTLVGAGEGSVTLPANYGAAGRTLIIEGWGYHSATGSPTIQIRIYKGSTLLLDTTAVTSSSSTNALIQIRAVVTWRSPTSVFCQGFYEESGGGSNNFQMVTTAATTVGAGAEALNITATWGTASASDTITLSNLTVRGFN